MRKFIFLNIVNQLKLLTEQGATVIKCFDLWNEQIAFIEQEEVFDLPAVFVEFLPIQWDSLKGGTEQRAKATLRLHILTQSGGSSRDGATTQQDALSRFDLLDKIDALMVNLLAVDGGSEVSNVIRASSYTNHNHEEVIEDITEYRCTLSCRLE